RCLCGARPASCLAPAVAPPRVTHAFPTRRSSDLVMTNSLSVANALRDLEHEPALLMTGGTWDPHSESFQGQVAEQVLRSYDFDRSVEHTSELQSREKLVCRLLLEKKNSPHRQSTS